MKTKLGKLKVLIYFICNNHLPPIESVPAESVDNEGLAEVVEEATAPQRISSGFLEDEMEQTDEKSAHADRSEENGAIKYYLYEHLLLLIINYLFK